MRIVPTPEGWEDCESRSGERTVLQRLNRMVDEARRDAETGIGEPERLSGDLVVVQARYRY